MVEIIRKENNPIEYLKTLKVPLFATFKSRYFQISKEKTAAHNLCYLLKTPIITPVTGALGRMIADEMMFRPAFHSKRALKAQILLDLGEKTSFESFAKYLTDAKGSVQEWIEIYTRQHCAQVIGGKSRLEIISERKVQEIIAAITDAANDVTPSPSLPNESNISDWLSQLHGCLSSRSVLTLDEREIKEVVGAENLEDFGFFSEEFIKGLDKIQESLLEDFQSSPFSQMDSWREKPYDILYDSEPMLGCCEQCPFGEEQCELTMPNHGCRHTVELHRPECLGGYKWLSTGKMVLETCPANVGSKATFQNSGNHIHTGNMRHFTPSGPFH